MGTPSEWEYFTVEELRCEHCGEMHMDNTFMHRMVLLRRACSFPFIVTSGYRCPEYNNSISTTGLNGPHTTGRAMDIHVTGEEALEVVSKATAYGMTGVGIKQKGAYNGRFIHLDDLEKDLSVGRTRPHIWTY